MSRRRPTTLQRVRRNFDWPAMKRVCEAYELDFERLYPDLTVEIVEQRKTNNFYYFADRGSDILFVAHLDTVVAHERRGTTMVDTVNGPVVHSGALDDRLGAYIGLELLPRLGCRFDILLTVGEESGQSTAEFFTTDKEYNWVIEFDRGGTDVVMYQYQDLDTADLVRESGAKVGHGSFSDIAELEHLGVKCFNWGCGYDGVYHSTKGYVYLDDTFEMVDQFLAFYRANKDTRLPHEKKRWQSHSGGYRSGGYDGFGGYGRSHGNGSPGKGHGTGVRKWDPVKKTWVDAEPKKTEADRAGKKDSGYHGHGFDDDDPITIMGKTYPSYDAWWNETHPDMQVDKNGDPVDLSLWGV